MPRRKRQDFIKLKEKRPTTKKDKPRTRELPNSVKAAIQRQYPKEAELYGIAPTAPHDKHPAAKFFGIKHAEVNEDDRVVVDGTKRKGTKGGKKCSIGNIAFDSMTEASIYVQLKNTKPAVFPHGCLALAPDCHMRPDYIIAEVINKTEEPMTVTLLPGQFVGQLADAKSTRRKNGQVDAHAHAERDWIVKKKWAEDKFGLKILVLTKETDFDPKEGDG